MVQHLLNLLKDITTPTSTATTLLSTQTHRISKLNYFNFNQRTSIYTNHPHSTCNPILNTTLQSFTKTFLWLTSTIHWLLSYMFTFFNVIYCDIGYSIIICDNIYTWSNRIYLLCLMLYDELSSLLMRTLILDGMAF